MAGSDQLIDRLRALPAETATVMLVGHNPGLQELILDLATTGDQLERVRGKFPTGGLATVELDVEKWEDVAPETGRLVGLVRPRELG